MLSMSLGALIPLSPDNENAQDRDEAYVVNEVDRRYEVVREGANRLHIGGRTIIASPQDLILDSEIGHGSCGHVSKMKFQGMFVAVKCMTITGNPVEKKRILMDLDVATRASGGPNIVDCFGYFISGEKVMICMELAATCLDRLLERTGNTPIPEQIIAQIALSVLKALDYLKETHLVIHRDIKPSNILLDWDGNVKLCDFGISGNLIQSKAYTRQAGCPPYMAPERLNPSFDEPPPYDVRSDVWSLGLTLVELARGGYPYENCSSEFDMFAAILTREPPNLRTEEGFSPNFVHFVSLLLKKNVEERPKYRDLLAHPFIIAAAAQRDQTIMGDWLSSVMTLNV